MSCILCQNAPARTAWKNTTLIMDMNYKQECFCKSASAIVKCAPLQDTLERTTWRKLLECCCIDRNCCELIIELSGREVLSRMVKERHVPPSLPSWRQVSETWLQKRPPGRNLGDHCLLRRSGTTSIGTVALVFCWRMRSYHRTEFFFSIFVEYNTPLMPFVGASFFNNWIKFHFAIEILFEVSETSREHFYRG